MKDNNPNPLFDFLDKGVYAFNSALIIYSSKDNSVIAVPGSGDSRNKKKTYLYTVDAFGRAGGVICPGIFASYLNEEEKLKFALIFDKLILGSY